MKKLFLGSVALVALGLAAPAAFAADRGVPAYAPPPPPAPVYTWTGCYVGASAGNSWGRSEHRTVGNSILTAGGLGVPGPAPLGVPGGGVIAPVPAGTSIAGDLNLSGFIGGFQGGCNYQMGMWVIGFEGDGSATNKEGQNFEVGLVPFLGNGRANWVSQTQERWLSFANQIQWRPFKRCQRSACEVRVFRVLMSRAARQAATDLCFAPLRGQREDIRRSRVCDAS
jgi:opacity protein-like surface antigen